MSDYTPSDQETTREDSESDFEPGAKSTGKGKGKGKSKRAAPSPTPPPPPKKKKRTGARVHVVPNLTKEDIERVKDLHAKRMAIEKARIQRLTLEQCQLLLQRCLQREPGLIFDLLAHTPDPPPTQPPNPQAPDWCVCSNCKNMPTLLEQKCCRQPPQSCVSNLPHMELYILQDGVLRLARRIWNDLRADVDPEEEGESHRQFRFAAYRQFVVWRHGFLGPGNRVVIPSCCVWRIRGCFPDPHGNYVGFIPTRV